MAANEAMIEYWNGAAGQRWVDAQERYDDMLDPLTVPLIERLALSTGERAIDLGCGSGSLTVDVARRTGAATGADISEALLERCAIRAQQAGVDVTTLLADVQDHPFEPASFDVVTSRFGVMFFADPVAAFANVARATRPGGRLAVLVWQERSRNEWMEVPMGIGARHVAEKPADPTAPGPWSFGDADRVRSVLADAGWADVELESSTGTLALGGGGTLEESVGFVIERGTVSNLLGDADASIVDAVRAELLTELAPFHDGKGLQMGYATWIVTASKR